MDQYQRLNHDPLRIYCAGRNSVRNNCTGKGDHAPGAHPLSALVVFLIFDILSPKEALAGFSNKGMITVGLLFLVSEGVKESGFLNKIGSVILPKKRKTIPRLLMQIMLPVSAISAFLNNTPVVIIFGPLLKKWADKMSLPSQKFLIPLSYATIFGGTCTLIGTSTNLLVHGMMLDRGMAGLGMFELAKVGLFIVAIGFLYLNVFANRLLPGRKFPGSVSPTISGNTISMYTFPKTATWWEKRLKKGACPA